MQLSRLLALLSLSLTRSMAVPAPHAHAHAASPAEAPTPNPVVDVAPRQMAPLALPTESHSPPQPSSDIEPPRDDGLVPFAGGGPVLGKFVKPTFTPVPGGADNVLPFPNSVELKKRGRKPEHVTTASNAFCPYPGTAYCCNPNFGTGGTLCKWNGDGHLAGCELITGGESVCCSSLGCQGMEGLKEPITTI